MIQHRRVLLSALVVGALALLPGDWFHASSAPLQPPSARHWFGTDDLGRDLFEGVVLGARLSLGVGLSAALLALGLGAAVGLLSGYAGGWVDDVLGRLIELFQIVPRFFLAFTVLTLWDARALLLILVLGVTSWSGLARIARAEALALRQREFVLSAQAAGGGAFAVLVRHLLPNAAGPLLAATPLVAAQAMVAEAGLSFLGVGTTGGVSWGYLLQNAQAFLREAWWMAFFPGLALTATTLALSWKSLQALQRAEPGE